MSFPWDLSVEDSCKNDASTETMQPTLLAHYCALRVDRTPREELQTGLLCDLDSSHVDPASVRRLLAAGLTVARLDVQHLEAHARAQLVQSIRRAVLDYSAELGFVYPLAVALDVRGPDLAIGGLASAPLHLTDNRPIRLTTDEMWRDCGNADCLYVGWERLADLQPGDTLHIESFGSRHVELIVDAVDEDSAECTVVHGGAVGPHATVRVARVPHDVPESKNQSAETLADSSDASKEVEHVERQVAWAIQNDVDALFAPAESAFDVQRMRELLGESGKHVLLLACIETAAAMDAVDGILEAADGLYLDRSVLAADLNVEKIFIAQKTLSARCSREGKPFVCRSVINEQIPTLCVGDLASLALDGVDVVALELHYELLGEGDAATRATEQCLAAAGVVLRHAESVAYKPLVYGNLELMQSPLEDPTRAVCVSAVELAMRSRAAAVVCLTTSGRSAKLLAHARPPCPVVAVTRSCQGARQMRLWRGLRSLHYTEAALGTWECEMQARTRAALRYLVLRDALHAGDAYVVTSASRRGIGFTDTVRLAYASPGDTLLD